MNDSTVYDRYLSGRMGDSEIGAFKATLRADSVQATDFIHYAVETAMIVRVGSQMESRDAETASSGWRRVRFAAAWRRRWAPGLAAAAAAVALLAGGFVWGWHWRARAPGAPARGDAAVTATIAALEGDVAPLAGIADPASPALAVGGGLRPGDGLRTGAAGRLRYVYGDGTAVDVGPHSFLALTAGLPATAKAVRLDAGTLTAWVRPQPSTARMTFATPHALATVLGTTLRLNVTPGRSELAVFDGRATFAFAGRELAVFGGERVTVGSEGLAWRERFATAATNGVFAVVGGAASVVSGLTRSVSVRRHTRNDITVTLRVRNGARELEAARSGAVFFRGPANTDTELAALPREIGDILAGLLAEEDLGAAGTGVAIEGAPAPPYRAGTNGPGAGAAWSIP